MHDLDAFVDGLESVPALVPSIGEAPAFVDWCCREVLPGPEVTSPDALRDFVAKAAALITGVIPVVSDALATA